MLPDTAVNCGSLKFLSLRSYNLSTACNLVSNSGRVPSALEPRALAASCKSSMLQLLSTPLYSQAHHGLYAERILGLFFSSSRIHHGSRRNCFALLLDCVFTKVSPVFHVFRKVSCTAVAPFFLLVPVMGVTFDPPG
jgi:hypothetical protein